MIKDMKMTVYSSSRLSAFEKCPRQYKYAYIERLPRKVTVEAFMGTLVHESLRKLYQDLMHARLDSLEEILSYYHDMWEKNWTDDIRIVKEYSAENYRKIGAACISDYYNRYKPFNQSRTLALEKKIKIDVDGYRLHGYIDRLAESAPGCCEIHDYKTSQTLPMREHLLGDRQLALYQIGVEETWDFIEQTDLVWHYLVHGKELRIRHGRMALERLKSDTIALIERLERAVDEDDFPARESELCPWCSYREICPTQKHPTKISKMPSNTYLNDPGVKLVDEYARLMEEKQRYMKKIEDELEQLREVIIAFAEREGLEVIQGSHKRLRVKKTWRVLYPTKKEATRRELDELLKKEGIWMDVSDLNPYALNKALACNQLSRELVEKIKRFQRLEESYKLYLSTHKS